MIGDSRHLHILEGHPVQFGQILLYLVLRQVRTAPEFELVGGEGFRRAREHHLMADKLNRLSRPLEARCDGRLDTLRTEILFKIEPLLVILLQLTQVFRFSLLGGFKVAETWSV